MRRNALPAPARSTRLGWLWSARALCLLVLAGCNFDPAISHDAQVRCARGADCPDDDVCLLGSCVAPSARCIEVSGREATPVPDGARCDDDAICIAGACLPSRCGDGVVAGDETCDASAGCREDCTFCGDGLKNSDEACDDGADNSDTKGNACRLDCTEPRCGDGTIDAGEGCDDGEANSDSAADACRIGCVRARCGDGVVDSGEACDASVGCRADCAKVELCGDGEQDSAEACDDGNANPLDGCDACRVQEWESAVLLGAAPAATSVGLGFPTGVAVDPLGRVYFADTLLLRVMRLDPDGTVTTVAGNGSEGADGDGGPATSASLTPFDVAVDTLGRVHIACGDRVRRVDVDGVITTIAGTGAGGFGGDGGPATLARLSAFSVAVDASGRLLIGDVANNRVRRVAQDGVITTIAGTGSGVRSGNGGPATAAGIENIADIDVEADGGILVLDVPQVRRIAPGGNISRVAGSGAVEGAAADGGLARDARLTNPRGVASDHVGGFFIVEEYEGDAVRHVDAAGIITTVAGNRLEGFSGDGGPAVEAQLDRPSAVVLDGMGRLIIADELNSRLRRVEAGIISTVAGNAVIQGPDGDGLSALAIAPAVQDFTVDALDRLVVSSFVGVQRVEADGSLAPLAGSGAIGDAGDGGPATAAELGAFLFVAVDGLGRLVISDPEHFKLRRVDADGIITTIAGTGFPGSFDGEGGPAVDADLTPGRVAADSEGRVWFIDSFSCVRRVEQDGTLVTVAGGATQGFAGEGVPATQALLNDPVDLALDGAGRMWIADRGNNRIRQVDGEGIISTVAGTGGDTDVIGEGVSALLAELPQLASVAVDRRGRVVLSEQDVFGEWRVVRRIDAQGTITTLARGGPLQGDSIAGIGDGGAALDAELLAADVVAVDAADAVLVGGWSGFSIRRIDSGDITTVVGPAHPEGPGPFARAHLYPSRALMALAPDEVLSVGETGRVARLDLGAQVLEIVLGWPGAAPTALSQARFATPLDDARGIALDPMDLALIVTEHGSRALRRVELDEDGDGTINDPASWTNSTIPTALSSPAGIAYDAASDTFLVVEEDAHCVRRVDRAGALLDVVFGVCGSLGSFPGFLNAPTHVAVSSVSGAIYLSDTGNHRILRVDGAGAAVVVGDGSQSSAGEGIPARQFPADAPRQLTLDSHGNLFFTSTTTVRMVANVDGDADADGDDRVGTLYGAGDRTLFPESASLCIQAIAQDGSGVVYAADGCQSFVVRIAPVLR